MNRVGFGKHCTGLVFGVLLSAVISFSIGVEEGITSRAADAADNSSEFVLQENNVSYRVNPLYQGVIRESDLHKAKKGSVDSGVVLNADKCTTVDEMAKVLRDGMVARNETIRVYFQLPGTTYTASDLVTIEDNVFNKSVDHTGIGVEGDYLKWGYSGVGMQISYGKSEGNTIGTLSYYVTYYTDSSQEAAVTNKLNQISSSLGLSGKNDYQKICAVYNYVCDNVSYDYGTSMMKYTCYNAVMKKSAVCQGYSLMIYRLLNDAGVDCRLIAGNTSSGPHGWNIVKIGGLYYNCDSTWDSGYRPENYRYFLKSDAGLKGHTRWEEYTAADFVSRYPVSGANYNTTKVDSSIKSLKLKKTNLTLKAGETTRLTTKVSPTSSTELLKFKSSNNKVAKIDSTGMITAVKAGTCVITVSSSSGKVKDNCYVTVKDSKNVAVKSVKLNKKKLTLQVSGTYTLKVTVKPKNATNQKVTFKSSNKSVATVNKKGKITAKKPGTCVITVTTKDGKKTAKCTVKVK